MTQTQRQLQELQHWCVNNHESPGGIEIGFAGHNVAEDASGVPVPWYCVLANGRPHGHPKREQYTGRGASFEAAIAECWAKYSDGELDGISDAN